MVLYKHIFLGAFFLIFFGTVAFSQQSHCFTTEHWKKNYGANPIVLDQVKTLRNQLTNLATQKSEGDGDIYTIPVVVHILYNTGSQNIDDERIYSQLNVLNEDFRRLNPDTSETPSAFENVVADIQVEFCLAIFDPNGDSTTGITRTFTDTTSFGLDNSMKRSNSGGIDAWDADSYLNIWVCNLPSDILGFSSLPGFPEEDDGIVINYRYFGDGFGAISPYNLGRTATHEIGHYLGLSHVWGDDGGSCSGSDLIPDTPNQAKETYGCPSFPVTDGCSPDNPGIMFMNYMDYTNDGCMNMFTEGQKTAMRTVLETTRSSLLLSPAGCNDIVPIPGAIAEIFVSPNPTQGGFTLSVKNFEGSQLLITVYNSLGQIMAQQSEEPAVVANEYIDLTGSAKGVYIATAFNGTYLLSTKFIIL